MARSKQPISQAARERQRILRLASSKVRVETKQTLFQVLRKKLSHCDTQPTETPALSDKDENDDRLLPYLWENTRRRSSRLHKPESKENVIVLLRPNILTILSV